VDGQHVQRHSTYCPPVAIEADRHAFLARPQGRG
jgi:hypothetical protein